MISATIRQTIPRPRTFAFSRKQRIYGCCGTGTFATAFGSKIALCEFEFGGSLCGYVVALDNNVVSVSRSLEQVQQVTPNLRWRIRHLLDQDLCRIHFDTLANSEYQFGYNGSLSAPLPHTKTIHRTINATTGSVARDRRSLLQAPIQLIPISTSGAHALIPQHIFNYEIYHASSPQYRVGLIATPEESDVASVSIFRKIFPLVINEHRLYNCFVIWDNGLWHGRRSVHQQDTLIARTILGATHAFTADSSFPAIGDILETLLQESNIIGVAATDYQLQLKRRVASPFKRFADQEQVIESVVNGLERVTKDPGTKLVDAKPSSRSQFIIVTGRFTITDFWKALDQIILPRTTKVLAAPSSSDTITVGQLFPVDGCLESAEKFWGLKRSRPKTRNKRYSLPADIVHDSLKETMPILRKVAEYLHIEPQQLLNPVRYNEQEESETGLAESEEGTVTIKQEGATA